jgi:hypothetical protein
LDFLQKENIYKNYVSRLHSELSDIIKTIDEQTADADLKALKGHLNFICNNLSKYRTMENFWSAGKAPRVSYGEGQDKKVNTLYALVARARSLLDYTNRYVLLGHVGEYATKVAFTTTNKLIDDKTKEILEKLGIKEMEASVIGDMSVFRAT